ncbi:MAG: DsbC family protein [Thermodesulfovibrionales bacterium]|nr:DsbC family protein [Thermodesulfovibrionales bacterium]
MKKTLLIILLLISLPLNSYAFPNKKKNCTECHKLTTAETATFLKDISPNTKVLSIKTSPIGSLWEVVIENNNKKSIIYIDFTKKHLISGSIYSLKDKKNITQERFEEITKIDASQIPLGDAIVIGNKNAKHKVIVFTDPDCPHCKRLHSEIKKVIAERSDIVFYNKMFPLKIHPEAYDKSKAIVCEKSLELLENAFDKKPIPKAKCDTTAIDDNIKLAEKLGITGTPTIILPDGRVIPGYKDAKSLKELIDKK